MSANTLGREPIQLIKIVQPTCSLTYSSGSCTATGSGNNKCYNTRATCQDAANYNQTDEVSLYFTSTNFNEVYSIPSLDRISTSPTIINTGSSGKDYKPLGVRGTLTATFNDHAHTDKIVDPYLSERSFDPIENSTFWIKWLKRNPYYKNWEVILYDGYIGEELAEMTSRAYVIDSLSMGNNGSISLKGKDVLALADDKNAQAPALSEGELIAAINTTDTTLRITGADAADYPAPNYIRVGDEVVNYTGVSTIDSTEINLTGCTRAQFNTEAAEHDEDERVQLCYYFNSVNAVDVIYTLLTTYAGISASYINTTDWDSERDTWLSAYDVTTLITEPVGINTLLGELAQQCSLYIWWDERTQKIKLQAVRAATGDVSSINEDKHIIKDSTSLKQEAKERISQVWLLYGMKDYTKGIKETNNYLNVSITADLDSETDEKYGEQSIKKIYSRWLTTQIPASTTGDRILSRYANIPSYIKVSLDAKDRDLWTGDMVNLTNKLTIDFAGNEEPNRYQIISADEKESGHSVEYKLMNFPFNGQVSKWTNDAGAGTTNAGQWTDDDGLLSDGITEGGTWQ